MSAASSPLPSPTPSPKASTSALPPPPPAVGSRSLPNEDDVFLPRFMSAVNQNIVQGLFWAENDDHCIVFVDEKAVIKELHEILDLPGVPSSFAKQMNMYHFNRRSGAVKATKQKYNIKSRRPDAPDDGPGKVWHHATLHRNSTEDEIASIKRKEDSSGKRSVGKRVVGGSALAGGKRRRDEESDDDEFREVIPTKKVRGAPGGNAAVHSTPPPTMPARRRRPRGSMPTPPSPWDAPRGPPGSDQPSESNFTLARPSTVHPTSSASTSYLPLAPSPPMNSAISVPPLPKPSPRHFPLLLAGPSASYTFPPPSFDTSYERSRSTFDPSLPSQPIASSSTYVHHARPRTPPQRMAGPYLQDSSHHENAPSGSGFYPPATYPIQEDLHPSPRSLRRSLSTSRLAGWKGNSDAAQETLLAAAEEFSWENTIASSRASAEWSTMATPVKKDSEEKDVPDQEESWSPHMASSDSSRGTSPMEDGVWCEGFWS